MHATSIIVPAYNAADTLPRCLGALRAVLEPGLELVVVDDASSDGTAEAAAALGARVLRRTTRGGVGAARNHGVAHTDGAVLMFVDADVAVAPDTVARAMRTLAAAPELAGVFGSYDAAPPAPGTVSQFRNLLHHYVHQRSNPEAVTFWAGCGALRRDVFAAAGGFDEVGAADGMEDVELGYRLHAAGRRLRLDRDMLCTHLKHWTLGSMLRTDLFTRAIPWARLVVRERSAPRDLNLTASQRWSVVLTAVLASAVPALAWPAGRWIAVLALAGVVALNWRFYDFLRRARGLRVALACVPLHLLHFLCGGLGMAWACLEALWPRRRRAGDVAA